MGTERQILQALLAKRVNGLIADFIAEQMDIIRELGMNPEEIKELCWELLGEAMQLRQQHKKIA